MQEKCLIGFVIHNHNNMFLLTRTIKNGLVDYGLVSQEIFNNITNEKLANIIKQNLCININPNNLPVLIKGTDSDGDFIIYNLQIDKNTTSMYSIINNKTEFLWLSYSQILKLYNEKYLNTDQLLCINKCYEKIQNT